MVVSCLNFVRLNRSVSGWRGLGMVSQKDVGAGPDLGGCMYPLCREHGTAAHAFQRRSFVRL